MKKILFVSVFALLGTLAMVNETEFEQDQVIYYEKNKKYKVNIC
ncbi:hypothetical protein ACF3NR_06830 [Vaginella massiliensis]|nr:hypothetical protein [Vaginella massiliensis]